MNDASEPSLEVEGVLMAKEPGGEPPAPELIEFAKALARAHARRDFERERASLRGPSALPARTGAYARARLWTANLATSLRYRPQVSRRHGNG